ncbi:hypothetical protein AAFC00_003650 [Neodothiora populina]
MSQTETVECKVEKVGKVDKATTREDSSCQPALSDTSNTKPCNEAQVGAVQAVGTNIILKDQESSPDPGLVQQAVENVVPKLKIGPPPQRLRMSVPPLNFGAVDDASIYRSGYPKPENFSFLQGLKLKTILTLVPEPLSAEYLSFVHENGIRHVQIHIPANKDGIINITQKRMCMALSVVLERKNHPLLIHCNRGKHRTGCVVACLRKIQQSAPIGHHNDKNDDIVAEYRDYSHPKCRDDDMAFIRSFDPSALYAYASSKGWPVTPPPEPSNEKWADQEDALEFSLVDIASMKVPEEPDDSSL